MQTGRKTNFEHTRGSQLDPLQLSAPQNAPFYASIKLKMFYSNRFFTFAVSHSKTVFQTFSLYKHLISLYHPPFTHEQTDEHEEHKPKKKPYKPRNGLDSQIPTPENSQAPENSSYFQIPARSKHSQISIKDSLRPPKHNSELKSTQKLSYSHKSKPN